MSGLLSDCGRLDVGVHVGQRRESSYASATVRTPLEGTRCQVDEAERLVSRQPHVAQAADRALTRSQRLLDLEQLQPMQTRRRSRRVNFFGVHGARTSALGGSRLAVVGL